VLFTFRITLFMNASLGLLKVFYAGYFESESVAFGFGSFNALTLYRFGGFVALGKVHFAVFLTLVNVFWLVSAILVNVIGELRQLPPSKLSLRKLSLPSTLVWLKSCSLNC